MGEIREPEREGKVEKGCAHRGSPDHCSNCKDFTKTGWWLRKLYFRNKHSVKFWSGAKWPKEEPEGRIVSYLHTEVKSKGEGDLRGISVSELREQDGKGGKSVKTSSEKRNWDLGAPRSIMEA